MRWFAVLGLMLMATPAVAAKDKMQFWNETSHEMTGVYLAPAGSNAFGPNQALNDPDKAVSADERLDLVGVTAGKYDVKLIDTKGRTCVVRGIDVMATGKVAFAIAENQLTDCKSGDPR